MSHLAKFVALALSAALAPSTFAQAPPTARTTQTPPVTPYPTQSSQRRSVVHHYAYPYPGYYHGDQSAGFRNPGGTGRYLEYYPANNQFQVNTQQDAVKVATFGGGGVPDRNSQMAAQSLGVSKYNSIQNHIDTMARPMMGVGFFGGFGF